MAPKFTITVTAVLALLLFVFSPAASAQNYTSTGGASFSNPTPKAGENLTISGTTTPDTLVTVTIEGAASASNSAAALARTTLGSTTSDATGAYSVSVTIPAQATGSVVVTVMADGQTIGSTNYSIGSAATESGVSEQAAQTPVDSLPVTGSATTWFVTAAALLLAFGGVLMGLARGKAVTVQRNSLIDSVV